jgi:glutathione S-transferase
MSTIGTPSWPSRQWFAGPEITAADIMMSFPLEAGAARAGAASRPHVKAFLERIHARPAYRKR